MILRGATSDPEACCAEARFLSTGRSEHTVALFRAGVRHGRSTRRVFPNSNSRRFRTLRVQNKRRPRCRAGTARTSGISRLSLYRRSSRPARRGRGCARHEQAFFALPESEKLKLRIDRNFRGYLPFAGSTIVTSSIARVSKPNQSESIFFLHETAPDDPRVLGGEPLQGPNQWPDEAALPGFRAVIEH